MLLLCVRRVGDRGEEKEDEQVAIVVQEEALEQPVTERGVEKEEEDPRDLKLGVPRTRPAQHRHERQDMGEGGRKRRGGGGRFLQET